MRELGVRGRAVISSSHTSWTFSSVFGFHGVERGSSGFCQILFLPLQEDQSLQQSIVQCSHLCRMGHPAIREIPGKYVSAVSWQETGQQVRGKWLPEDPLRTVCFWGGALISSKFHLPPVEVFHGNVSSEECWSFYSLGGLISHKEDWGSVLIC